jgi:hypothetical protein
MPWIEWTALPANVREHLLDRVRTRAIRAQDLAALLAWIKPSLSFLKGRGARTSRHSNWWGRARYLKRFLKKINRVSGSGFE